MSKPPTRRQRSPFEDDDPDEEPNIDAILPKRNGKRGRPPAMDEKFLIQLESYCRLGCSLRAMAALLEVDQSTITRWCQRSPHLKRLMEKWKQEGRLLPRRQLFNEIVKGNLKAIIFQLKHDPDYQKSEKDDDHDEGDDSGEIESVLPWL